MPTVIVATLFLAAWAATAQAGVDCDVARCAAQNAIDQQCPCDGAASPGLHMRCVAKAARQLAADGVIPAQCKGAIRRCAARSTCGRKPGSVTCEIPAQQGTCAVGLGFCTYDGVVRYSMPCSTPAECVIGGRCGISSSAERCAARGGTAVPRSSCCRPCEPTETSCIQLGCRTGEMCVIREPVGPTSIQTCEPIPAGCAADRTCGCTAASLCLPPFDECADLRVLGDAIICRCALCQ
jgi:hypothetical protein